MAKDGQRTLLDCIPVERERQWALDCEKSLQHLKDGVERLSQLHQKISSGVDKELSSSIFPNRTELSTRLSGLENESQEVQRQCSILKSNYERVEKEVIKASTYDSSNVAATCHDLDQLFIAQEDSVCRNL